MKPVVDRLEQEYQGKVEFKIYNVETSEEGSALMRSYGAQYVPTFVFLNRNGSEAGRLVGEVAEEQLRSKLDSLK